MELGFVKPPAEPPHGGAPTYTLQIPVSIRVATRYPSSYVIQGNSGIMCETTGVGKLSPRITFASVIRQIRNSTSMHSSKKAIRELLIPNNSKGFYCFAHMGRDWK